MPQSRIAYVDIPHLPVQVERQRNDGGNRPLVVGGRPWDPGAVLDCDDAARAAGVEAGMRLARAAARCPDAAFVTADSEAYQNVQTRLEVAMRPFTDRIETAGLGRLLLDISHTRRRHPEDEELAHRLLRAARAASGLDVRVGMADRRFTAEQAARAAERNRAWVVPPKDARAFLSGLPLNALPIDDRMQRRLILVGVHTLGELSRLPRLAVIRQFGTHAGFLHDLASGRDPRTVHPDAPPLELRHRHTFDPPALRREWLDAQTDALIAAMAERLRAQGYQAQGMRLQLTEADERRHTETGSIEPPTANADRLIRQARAHLNAMDLQSPLQTLTVALYPLRPTYLGASQLALFSAPRDGRMRRLRETLRRLRARFGELVLVIASLIEPPRPRAIQVTTGEGAQGDAQGDARPRALIWHGRIHPVRRCYEHWRERRAWWAQTIERDYYRLEDAGGRVHLVYHDRLSEAWWLERRSPSR
jgi:DNA polymerase-4